jgi:hypothetical protein
MRVWGMFPIANPEVQEHDWAKDTSHDSVRPDFKNRGHDPE